MEMIVVIVVVGVGVVVVESSSVHLLISYKIFIVESGRPRRMPRALVLLVFGKIMSFKMFMKLSLRKLCLLLS